MERITCRTCLSIADIDRTFHIFEKCSITKTIKDVLLEYIPQMEKTLSEKDRVCYSCSSTLRNFVELIEKCLNIEESLMKDDTSLLDPSKNPDFANDAEIIENIQIVLDDELRPYFSKPSTSTDIKISVNNASTGTINHDHSYIKVSDETGLSLIKTEASKSDDEDDPNFQEDLSSHSHEPENNFDEDSSDVQFIPVADISDEVMQTNFEDASSSSQENILVPNITVLATGDQLGQPDYLQIKEESNDSLTAGRSDGIRFYQTVQDSANIYPCDICGDGFLSHQSLQQHYTLHGEFRIMCDKCPKIFKNDSALKAHYKLKHLEVERFKCNVCGQMFGRADYLRNHLKRHEDEKKNNIKCRVPGKFLRFKNSEDPLPCKICGKYYNGIQKLKVHLQTHLVVKRFACEYCDLTYKRWPSLKRHEKTHLESDTFFYRCNVCWKRFVQKEDLDQHMNQHGNPRYRCQVCDAQFHRKYLFDNHYLLSHATPEDIENSKKEVIYDTLLELSSQTALFTE